MTRFFVAALAIGASAPMAAQTLVPGQLSAETSHQVRVFENNLLAALERAGQQLADRAREVVPDIQLQLLTLPKVTGIVMPQGESFVFVIEAPTIEGTSAMLWDVLRRLQQPANGAPRVPNAAVVGTAAPVAVGNAAGSPVLPGTPMTEPGREYSEFVRQALIDAMLDNALALPMKDGQTLTLVEAGGLQSNPLAGAPRKLYLQLKGEDLLALRQNRISREEAKKRILEVRR